MTTVIIDEQEREIASKHHCRIGKVTYKTILIDRKAFMGALCAPNPTYERAFKDLSNRIG